MIDWSHAIWAGLAGGMAMAILLALINVARAVSPADSNRARYQGCMITRRYEGTGRCVVGSMTHPPRSVLIGFAHARAFATLPGRSYLDPGIMAGAGPPGNGHRVMATGYWEV